MISFEVEDEDLKKVEELIQSGQFNDAREILSNALLSTYEFAGENCIPDNDACIAGVNELRGFRF